MLTVVVVLPTPPFWLATVSTRVDGGRGHALGAAAPDPGGSGGGGGDRGLLLGLVAVFHVKHRIPQGSTGRPSRSARAGPRSCILRSGVRWAGCPDDVRHATAFADDQDLPVDRCPPIEDSPGGGAAPSAADAPFCASSTPPGRSSGIAQPASRSSGATALATTTSCADPCRA